MIHLVFLDNLVFIVFLRLRGEVHRLPASSPRGRVSGHLILNGYVCMYSYHEI